MYRFTKISEDGIQIKLVNAEKNLQISKTNRKHRVYVLLFKRLKMVGKVRPFMFPETT